MKRPKIVCGLGSAPDPIGGAAYDAPPDLVSWGWGHPLPIPLLSTPFTAVVGRFNLGIRRKDGHPQFLKRGCALVYSLKFKLSPFSRLLTVLALTAQ